jgi:hypothetical protein
VGTPTSQVPALTYQLTVQNGCPSQSSDQRVSICCDKTTLGKIKAIKRQIKILLDKTEEIFINENILTSNFIISSLNNNNIKNVAGLMNIKSKTLKNNYPKG